MKLRILTLVIAATLPVAAQTKQSGTIKCPPPDPNYSIEVGDRPGHLMTLGKATKCEWTKPLESEGLKSKTGEDTEAGDVMGNSYRANGTHISTMDNGDKVFVRYQGTGTLKDGKTVAAEGKWQYVNGTGKLRSIKGTGTYKGKAEPDGSMVFEIEGEYSIAPPRTGKKK
jgi:hypothetical protein